MTIAIDSTVAAALTAAGTSNNPIVAWDNAADDGTLTTATGTEVEAAALAKTGSTYDPWIATPDTGTAILQLVLSSGQSLDFVAIAAHNLGDLGANVVVEYSVNSGSTWNDCGAGSVSPSDNQAIGFYFDSTLADYWRIKVTNAGSDDVEIGVALFSTVITLGQRIYSGYTPPITQTNVELSSNITEGGHFVNTAAVRAGSSTQANLQHIDPTFLRGATWKAFQRHFNKGGPFFWAWRPTKYGDLFYAWRSGNTIAPTNMGVLDLMSFSMEMRFYDDP